MAEKKVPLSEQVRLAIDGADVSRYAIGNATGIDHATISRFMNRKGGLSTEALDAIADYLDLELTPRKPAQRTSAKRPTKGKARKG
jgi:transcriptional regulator with XRE-family HTH domain